MQKLDTTGFLSGAAHVDSSTACGSSPLIPLRVGGICSMAAMGILEAESSQITLRAVQGVDRLSLRSPSADVPSDGGSLMEEVRNACSDQPIVG